MMSKQSIHSNKQGTAVAPQEASGPRPRVVIIGAGFGGLKVVQGLAEHAVEVTIIDRNNFHLFQPMLYQVATAGLSPADIAMPVRSIFKKQQNATVLMGHVTGVDVQKQEILFADQEAVPYDYVIIATGATSNYFGHQEWQQIAPGMKTLDDALKIRYVVLSAFEAAEREPDDEKRQALLTFVIVGGGPTGVELAGAIAELAHQALQGNFRRINPDMTRIILVEGEPKVLPSFPNSLICKAQKKLRELGVELKLGVHVKQISKTGVEIGDQHVETENIIWTAGVKASPAGEWLQAPVDHDGRVKVQPDLTVPGHLNTFVIGDTALAMQKGRPLPGLAPVAMQQGKYVASVIANEIEGEEHRRPFHYFDKGTLATVGRSFAVVDIGPIHFTGLLAWFTWVFVHLLFLVSFRNRVLVAIQYAWSYLTSQRGARIILPGDAIREPE